MIRKLLFILFLYVLLVWLIATYYFFGDSKQLVEHGIFWTAVGVGALLAGFVIDRLVAWRRQANSAKVANPEVPVVRTSSAMHDDDVALLNLLREAENRLEQAPSASSGVRTKLLDLPLYLVVGPEGVGKTAVLQNSGMDPSLLAGQVLGSGAAVTSTRVANIWLASQSVFIDVSGRVFSSDPGRLAEFISRLQPGGASKGWRAWLQPFRKPLSLKGVLLVLNSRDLAGAPEPSVLDRTGQMIRERLLAICGVAGAEVPVYIILTKLDGLPYFEEYFARLTDEESGQVFGLLRNDKTSSDTENRVWADAETKRLNRAFQSLFGRLSDRRLLALTVEPDASSKPAIYEFPREFKRVRNSLVQLLVDIFKPDPLKMSPRLRGFFFTGTKKVERLGVQGDAKSMYSSQGPALEATHIFKPGMRASAADPSTVFGKGIARSSGGQIVDRWVFLSELFHTVLPSDYPAIGRTGGTTRFDGHKKYVVGAVAGLAALLGLIWTISWIGNWRLTARVDAAIASVQRGTNNLTLPSLQALDGLRVQLEELGRDDSLSLHWGLYEGDALREIAKRVYFNKLKRLSLEAINQILIQHLQGAAGEAQPTGATYDRLKTHRTIAVLGCAMDGPLVSKVLKAAAAEAHPGLSADQMLLLHTQLDYYAKELERSNRLPVRLAENSSSVEAARAYLRTAGGLDQQLRSILGQLNQQIKPVSVAESVEDYRSVLTGNPDVPGAFTKRGYELFDDLAAKAGNGGGEPCVMGTRARLEGAVEAVDSKTRDQLKSRYLREYANAWKDFLASYSVIRYSGTEDASRRIAILSGSRSPLLGIVKLIAVNTNFPQPKPGEPSFWARGAKALGINGVGDAQSKAEKAAADLRHLASGDDTPTMTTGDLASLFQPVLITTPAELDHLVSDGNSQYMEGLRKLQMSLDALTRASGPEKVGAGDQVSAAKMQALGYHHALADKFNDVGKEGLSKTLGDFLEQPIRLVAVEDRRSKPPGELSQLCRDIAPILGRYPFNPTSPIDASTNDISRAFAPMTGRIWKYALEGGADLVVRNGQKWERNPSWQGPRVTQELVNFLTQSQVFTNALFTEGGMMQPKLKYTLRPIRGAVPIHLILDGSELSSSQSALRKDFYWPAQGGDKAGAEGLVDVPGGAGFGRFDGLWGVFRLFQNADERVSGQTTVQWSQNRGRGGAVLQTINPPAKIEFVDFPGGVDLFNPKFFEALSCPGRAIAAN